MKNVINVMIIGCLLFLTNVSADDNTETKEIGSIESIILKPDGSFIIQTVSPFTNSGTCYENGKTIKVYIDSYTNLSAGAVKNMLATVLSSLNNPSWKLEITYDIQDPNCICKNIKIKL